ncbi:UDP-glucose 4-epimerase GalE [Streptomyces chrestomyceticus]|uniref:UDP-glucose 4-epimerase GalE n=1 Tax=Streptomyces chrestomyceticus TaxID=68185 RepID=UPI0033CBF03E
MKVLVTGGAGYIGSTIASALADQGIEPVILDNLITGRREFTAGRHFYEGDIADGALVDQIFAEHSIYTAVHCAALVVVPESVADPVRYYRENVSKTVEFTGHLIRNRCRRLAFSSSVSVYAGDTTEINEDSRISPSSPYAQTKAIVETFLRDIARTGALKVVALRYANPIGNDPKLRTGLQIDAPTHILGRLIGAAEGDGRFTITGTGWPTRDGSGLRDYIHVWDLAQAHVNLVQRFDSVPLAEGFTVLNLSSGSGTTVREMVLAFQTATKCNLDVAESETRPGDVAGFCADNARAVRALEWAPKLTISDAINDAMAWRPRRVQMLRTSD